MAQLPGGSSSSSLNESAFIHEDDMNYDSDVSESEDEHAIAEGEDDDDCADVEVGEDDEFEVEINTLTGNTFSVMIHPTDTVEMLKTRIAFQEGISPSEQHLLMDQGKILEPVNGISTVEELIGRRCSKLTLVTNVGSGTGVSSNQVSVPHEDQNMTEQVLPEFKAEVHNLAPTIKKNYRDFNSQHQNKQIYLNNNDRSVSTSSSTVDDALKLPNIFRSNNNDDNEQNKISDTNGANWNKSHLKRMDERVWMQSLFNKVVEQEESTDVDGQDRIVLRENNLIENIDSTKNTAEKRTVFPQAENGVKARRYTNTSNQYSKTSAEEDGSLLIVQGDDGVILIIQKSTGILNNSSNFKDDKSNFYSSGGKFDIDFCNGRLSAGVRKYREMSNINPSHRYQQNAIIHEKIKENAVTLEKMRRVRGMLAKNKQNKKTAAGKDISPPPRPPAPLNAVEFPRILRDSQEGIMSSRNGTFTGTSAATFEFSSAKEKKYCDHIHNMNNMEYGWNKRSGGEKRSSSIGTMKTRSINSSKMSLNRLAAEIYLQSKRKGHTFQPGQPPYTDQQLVRYVHLKIAILLDDERNFKREPCSKCQSNISLNKDTSIAPTYLLPTVVMDRVKRMRVGRMSKSLDQEDVRIKVNVMEESELRRKSLVLPVTTSCNKNCTGKCTEDCNFHSNRSLNITKHYERKDVGGTYDKSVIRDSTKGLSNSSTRASRRNSKANVSKTGQSTSSKYDSTIQACNAPLNPQLSATTHVIKNKVKGPLSRSESSKSTAIKKEKGPAAVRCQWCKKKIGIACRYQCRCGLTFCPTHRYPETHECPFDYKTEGRNKIRENNPVITAKKIDDI